MRKAYAWLGLVFMMLLVGFAQEPPKLPELDPKDKDEIEFGKQAAAEVEKQLKVIEDPQLNERVQRIGKILSDIARQTPVPAQWGDSRHSPFEYTFKIVKDPSDQEDEVNAFSLPGGFIYVYKGLLDFVQSDHELAGVLAHEIAHAAHHHVMVLVKEDNKVNRQVVLPVLLGALIGRLPSDQTFNLLQGTQLYRIARLNDFGQEAEKDSDRAAIEYLRKSPYNPVGLLTFMERLAAEEAKGPQIDWGIFRTHPPSRERAEAVYKALKDYGIPIRRREVSPALRIVARPISDKSDETQYEVAFEKIKIFRSADDPQLGSSKARAEKIAERLNVLLDEGVELFEVRLSPDKQGVLVKGEELVRVTAADSQLLQQSAEQTAKEVQEAIKRVLWNDAFRRLY